MTQCVDNYKNFWVKCPREAPFYRPVVEVLMWEFIDPPLPLPASAPPAKEAPAEGTEQHFAQAAIPPMGPILQGWCRPASFANADAQPAGDHALLADATEVDSVLLEGIEIRATRSGLRSALSSAPLSRVETPAPAGETPAEETPAPAVEAPTAEDVADADTEFDEDVADAITADTVPPSPWEPDPYDDVPLAQLPIRAT